jgi:hypothetical protein
VGAVFLCTPIYFIWEAVTDNPLIHITTGVNLRVVYDGCEQILDTSTLLKIRNSCLKKTEC